MSINLSAGKFSCDEHVAHSVISHGCVVQNIGFDSFIDDTEASSEGALTDDRDVGHFICQQRCFSRVLCRLLLESCRH